MTQIASTALDTSLLVTPEWLSGRFDSPAVRILDLRLVESYADGHIPNALPLDLNTLRTTRDGVEGMLIAPEAFASIAGRLGIDTETTVVLYDDHHGMPAARAAWSLLRYGHTRVALLDGGWDAWESRSLPIGVGEPVVTPRQFTVRTDDVHEADYAWVVAHLPDPDVILLDVRSQAEFDRGSLPGAVLWDWENGASDESTFGSPNALRTSLAAVGVTPDREIVTYCQSGVRASHTFLLLKTLGFERVRMYDGSWAEWSRRRAEVRRS